MSTLQGWNFTTRAAEQASAASLGNWRSTLRLNKQEDKNSLTNSVSGVIVGFIVLGASVLFLTRWHPQAPELWVAVLVMSLIGLGLIMVFGRELVHRYRAGVRGMLLTHVYDAGVVFERTEGQVFTVPFASSQLRYVTWDEGNDERHREQLWVTLADGSIRAVETWTADECRILAQLAPSLRLDRTPQLIAPVRGTHQPEPL
ncbi:hypothetical protein CQ018_04520 [Arthrobacter sp. MYb227]|uniref:hypothetical protein n=1 Tax=Arthrobacter sp. MYb227 TaxID=1848601 RepID=UPI000CFCE3CF|nr:hypothetical protein [Arthrobacter sp. MYb227]PQZ94625.1 hypothetical protein CQ018_04520 [Arthrobacter sp. MYb227]